MVGIIIIALIAFLVAWILVVPVRLTADSDPVRCRISQAGTMSFTVSVDERIHIDLSFFGISLPVDRWASTADSTKKRPRERAGKKNGKSKSMQAYFFLIHNLIRSFRVNILSIDVDTDNVITNAQLVPVLVGLSKAGVNLRTNYVGRVYVHLDLQCRIINILSTFIQFMFKK